jgi:hypothetical protein
MLRQFNIRTWRSLPRCSPSYIRGLAFIHIWKTLALAHGQWFSPGTPASSTTKIGRHDIAEILLKVALNTKYQ